MYLKTPVSPGWGGYYPKPVQAEARATHRDCSSQPRQPTAPCVQEPTADSPKNLFEPAVRLSPTECRPRQQGPVQPLPCSFPDFLPYANNNNNNNYNYNYNYSSSSSSSSSNNSVISLCYAQGLGTTLGMTLFILLLYIHGCVCGGGEGCGYGVLWCMHWQ